MSEGRNHYSMSQRTVPGATRCHSSRPGAPQGGRAGVRGACVPGPTRLPPKANPHLCTARLSESLPPGCIRGKNLKLLLPFPGVPGGPTLGDLGGGQRWPRPGCRGPGRRGRPEFPLPGRLLGQAWGGAAGGSGGVSFRRKRLGTCVCLCGSPAPGTPGPVCRCGRGRPPGSAQQAHQEGPALPC